MSELIDSIGIKELCTLAVFVAAYSGLAVGHWFFLKLDRTGIALLGSIAMLAFGCITLPQAVAAVNIESILLLFALMVIASQLHYAGLYGWLANRLLRPLIDRPAVFLAVLIALGGGLSAFLNNDVVVLAMAPIVASALIGSRINPIPFLIALALASNIGCALTTIGNAQNVLIGEIGGLRFGSYMRFAVIPVMLSLAVCYAVVYRVGRGKFSAQPDAAATIPAESDPPLNRWRAIKGAGVLAFLIFAFVFTGVPHYLAAMTGAGLLLCRRMLPSRQVLSGVNWQLLVLFIGLFVIVGAFVDTGLADDMLKFLAGCGVDLNNPIELSLISGAFSNCINNSAAVMLLIRVIDTTDPVCCYALALSNAFAGNLIVMGSLANIIVAQCAEDFKLHISFGEFFRYGAPTAVVSMIILTGWLAIMT